MKKYAYIGGSYDPPHEGHELLIKRVKALGFEPVVVVNSDGFIRSYKHREPFWWEEERARYFSSSDYKVRIVEQCNQRELIKEINPSVIVVGLDWMKPEILAQLGIDEQFLTDNGISMLFLPRTPGVSSTLLRDKSEELSE